jgi:DNA primase
MSGSTAKNDIEALTATVSLQRLVESKGTKLRKRGTTLTGTCPFHSGSKSKKRPVLTLDPKANTWACPACRVKLATVIEWLMKAESISRRHAIDLLRSDFGTAASNKKPSKAKKATNIKLDAFSGTDEPDHAVLHRVLRYYTDTLTQSPEAMAYLRDRKLTHGELIEKFRLGYSNRTLGYRMPARNRKHGFALRGQLERIGINRSSGHELFWGAITFPVFDADGGVQQIYGRKILGDSRLKRGTPLHLWLPGGSRGVFNPQAFTASTEIVICKGIIDALTLWCAGIRNVTACFGGFEPHADLQRALTDHGIKKLLIAFDRTKAGDIASEELAAEFRSKSVEVFRVLLPAGMDCNDYARSVDNAADALQQAVRSAVWLAGKARPATVPTAITETRDAQASTTASPAAPAPVVEKHEDEIILTFGDRRWRVRGLRRNTSYEQLRVNLLVSRANAHPGAAHGFHVDVVELYSARQRAAFAKQAGDELGLDEQTVKHDLGRVLMHLEQEQDALIRAELEPKAKAVEMSDVDREQALRLLRDPRLLERIAADLGECGLVGEPVNKVVAYLAATSRKLDGPLAVVIQSSSASGKTTLMDAVLDMMPEEERVMFSAVTSRSLFYMGESDLAHRTLAIAEEAGARRSSYALKLLQSEGELTIASTGKDPGTGRLVSQEYKVRGPVQLMLTTTEIDLDEELLNRCLILTVDESRDQTRRIHEQQRHRQTLDSLLARHDREDVVRLHRNAQRLLRPVNVVNPFAAELAFHDGQPKSRRDHAKYLGLIKAVTLLYQHQRVAKTVEHRGHKVEYIEVEQADIETANALAAEVLFDDADELPPQTRKVLDGIKSLIAKIAVEHESPPTEVKLTARAIREHLGISATPVKRHLRRLVDLEYLGVTRGPKRQSLYTYDAQWAHLEGQWAHPGLAVGSPPASPNAANNSEDIGALDSPGVKARPGKRSKSASYVQTRSK